MADRLELEARFNDRASAGVKRLGKVLDGVRPSNGMQAAQKWMGDFRLAADKADKAVRPLATGLSAVGIGGLAASLSMGELVKQFKDLADSTLTMRELGRQSRMSATEIARLQYAAGKLHVDPAAVGGAISAWSSKMVEFRRHTGRFYTELLRQNQDVAEKIEASSPIDGLKRTLDFLSRIKDPQIQKRWAEEAGVGDLVPMLGKGPQGLSDAFSDAAREVKPISAELQAAADRFNDATNRFNQSWSNLKNDIGPAVLEPMSKMIDRLDDVLKFAAKNPGDAAAVVGVGGLSAAALFARRRIMRGSMIAGGSGAAGELAGAAREQVKAGGSLLEAAIELKTAAAELRTRGGLPGGGGAPAEGEKPGAPGGKSPGYASLTFSGFLAALNLGEAALNAPGLDEEGQRRREANSAAGDAAGQAVKDVTGGWFGTDALRDKLFGPGRDITDVISDAIHGRSGTDKFSHPDDDRLSRARPDDLKKDVQEGSKAGIIAGLRELAQQQELGGGGGSFGGAAPGHGGNAGMPNLRYGRPKAGGGYRHGPGANDGGSEGAFNPRQPDKPGTYRPEYKLSDADLSDYVVNTVNGEATSSAESIDAVINNMMNRVGSKGWGPSANLRDVASAPGQYAGHRPASAQVAERIRDRIRAIASGGVPDNTNGSNAYRAAWYNGPWARHHAADGRVVGGNRFAYEPGVPNGPYAPFRQPTPGAGTPAPSAAALSDADVLAARQRILNGSRDPKDRALVDRYLKEQNTPKGHARGGPIRGPGTSTSDSIHARLSDGEFVVRAKAAGQWQDLLHAINEGQVERFADGGQVGKPLTIHGRAPVKWTPPAGFGVAKQFYPKSSPGISDAEGRDNRRSWLDFFRRSPKFGGMGAAMHTALGAIAMMQGESGRGLNTKLYGWDVNGPSGGVDQLHDVTVGKNAGHLHRLSDAMTDAMMQHVDWQDRTFQQAHFRKEATGSMWFAWRKMLAAKTARGALKEGIDLFENPANHAAELRRRMPNIVRLARETSGGSDARVAHEIDPVEVNIRHHPHTGQPIVTARSGRGVKLGIRSGPTMRPT